MGLDEGLIHACLLDGRGGGRFGGWELVRAAPPAEGLLWVHLDFRSPGARSWIQQESGMDEVSAAAVLADRTRPRSVARGNELLVDLRGVNLNPGARPDDMISVRLFLGRRRVITLRHRRSKAIEDLKHAVEEGRGPVDPGDFLADLCDFLLLRMAAAFEGLDQRIDALHARIAGEIGSGLRAEISSIRNQLIALRRYLAPQRDAVARLPAEKVDWLTELQRERLREVADRTARRVEDLDAARERAGVAHEELTGRMAERMNQTMYLLAIVASIFLPLGLITGLLGVNVGGIPGADDSSAFWVLCGLLLALAGLQFWLFRKHRML